MPPPISAILGLAKMECQSTRWGIAFDFTTQGSKNVSGVMKPLHRRFRPVTEFP